MNDPDDEVTAVIPLESMRELVFEVGYAPTGPERPTRELRPLRSPKAGSK